MQGELASFLCRTLPAMLLDMALKSLSVKNCAEAPNLPADVAPAVLAKPP
jgi:hypothetical protein